MDSENSPTFCERNKTKQKKRVSGCRSILYRQQIEEYHTCVVMISRT